MHSKTKTAMPSGGKKEKNTDGTPAYYYNQERANCGAAAGQLNDQINSLTSSFRTRVLLPLKSRHE